jgi:hypothetical protein
MLAAGFAAYVGRNPRAARSARRYSAGRLRGLRQTLPTDFACTTSSAAR